ncbi:hypothetical protein PENSPDRAFT_547973, partial [Peniophora sp. CONT]
PRANWRPTSDTKLIHTLEDQVRAGNKAGNGWKQATWVACARALAGSENEDGGAVKDANRCASRWKTLKHDHGVVAKLLKLSGFGWNSGTHTVDATQSVWDDYIEKHPSAASWRGKEFPHYEALDALIRDTV